MFKTIFGKKPTSKEVVKENRRELRKAASGLERDKRHLDGEEKKLIMEMKKMAKEGNVAGCKLLAKNIVELRKQKARTVSASSKIMSMESKNRALQTEMHLANALGTASAATAKMNRILAPEKIASDAKNFKMANMKMEMTDEMINDALEDILDNDSDEEKSDLLVQQVLDDISIEMSGKVLSAPSTSKNAVGKKVQSTSEDEVVAQLANLKTA